ncbi:MAG: hypothetical protein Q9166_001185 [cf. Caloplaca sp. 2 TL-2023]
MSSIPCSLALASKKPVSLLDLPLEIRYMIYDAYLPKTVTINQKNDPDLAVLSTCRQIYEEAVPILRNRSAVNLIIRDRKSYQLARSWIDHFGDGSSSRIQTLDIDSWTEIRRDPDSAFFRRYRFSITFRTGLPGFTVKYTRPGSGKILRYKYVEHCLGQRGDFSYCFRKVMRRLFGEAHEKPAGTEIMKGILEAVAGYSRWIHVGQTEHLDLEGVQRFQCMDSLQLPERSGWVYLYPSTVY